MIVTLKQINDALDSTLGRTYIDITLFATSVDDAAIAEGNVALSVKHGTVTFLRGPCDNTSGVSIAHVREVRRSALKAFGRGVPMPPAVGILCGEWSPCRTYRRVFPLEFYQEGTTAYYGAGLGHWFKTSLVAGRDAALAGEVPVARSASIGRALRATMRLYGAGWRPVVDSSKWLNIKTGAIATSDDLRGFARPD